MKKTTQLFAAISLSLGLAAATSAAPVGAFRNPINSVKHVVLVHGAWADGSGWQAVTSILQHDGYSVSVVQEPETSLLDDVDATTRVIDMQDGPVILVAHSYGGTVITEAGNDPKVVGLVYIAAFQPDNGESTSTLNQKIPPATTAIKQTVDGFLYLDPAQFHADFCADLPKPQADFMAVSQVLTAGLAFGTAISNPAWRNKPSWAVIPTEDRIINPKLERFMTNRAGSQTVEIKSSHAVYVSHAFEVAKVIEQAANNR